MQHGHAEMTTEQKSKPEVNSGDVITRKSEAFVMCVDLSDCNRYSNLISYRTQIPHYQDARMAKFT